MVKFCKYCFEHSTTEGRGYMSYLYDDNYVCPHCGNKVEDVDIPEDDYDDIFHISGDKHFIQAMIKLRQDDIIEYQSRMSQFRTQLKEKERLESEATPKCPHCKSTNIKPISGLNRGASIAMWGIFSKKINKSYECKKCGYTW